MKILILSFLIVCNTLVSYGQSLFTSDGLLKVATTNEGVYKLDQQFFREAGIDPLSIDPKRVQVFGMEGGLIPQENVKDYPESPVAIGMHINADEDAQLEAEESILFYADHVHEVYYDSVEERYRYEHNYYADSLYFFIDINFEGNQKQIASSGQQASSSPTLINYYEYLAIHELNQSNILSSGRMWFGESFFVDKTRVFDFDLPNPIFNSAQIDVETQYLGQSFSEDSLRIFVDDFLLAYQELPAISPISYSNEGYIVNNVSTLNTSLVADESTLSVQLTHRPSGSQRSDGKLDYLFLTVPLNLQFQDNQIILRNKAFQKGTAFTVSFGLNVPDFVWDISNPLSPASIQTNSSGEFPYLPSGEKEVKFVAFNATQAGRPVFVEQLSSFTLTTDAVPDFIIISHANFIQQAQRLASHRSSVDGYQVQVVDQQEVFDQFGAGRRDVSALRNFIRSQYLRDPQKLKYVLMVGAGSYDYKNQITNNSNYIPIYQSINSVSPTATYASDDFYAFMEEDEGGWIESNSDVSDMELGIGRIPCKTSSEAENIINKIIRYETDNALKGKWRNELYFIADDEDVNADTNSFYKQSDQLADTLVNNYGGIQPNKLYVGSFEQEVYASYERSPAMQEALTKMMQKGALIVNYIGHGAYNSWTDEAILTNNLISSWKNSTHFPLFITATCEFGRHDSPSLTSGAQVLLHQKNSGAIGLLTTSRPVFSNTNFELNKAFYQSAFERTATGDGRKLGDIIKRTKNNSISGVKNRNFILLGDPSMTLGLPKKEIVLETISSSMGGNDTIKAQDMITISGFISDKGNKLSDFQGTLIAEMFDKPTVKKTLVTDNPYTYSSTENILLRGKASVRNGEFEMSFYVPKEINYALGKGSFKLYAYQEEGMMDAGGYNNDIIIGGSVNQAIVDQNGPSMSLFLNDSTFRDGDRVGSKNELIVQLEDEYGISISSSKLNSGLYYQLDNGATELINDYFYYDTDSYQSGTAVLTLPEIKEGKHTLEVFARDILNNLGSSQIEFYVVDGTTISILDFMLYPNPAASYTNLQFTHSRKEESLLVDLNIIDSQGRSIFNQQYETEEYQNKVSWDLRTTGGQKVKAGMYFVHLMLRSTTDGAKTQEIKKLIIIN